MASKGLAIIAGVGPGTVYIIALAHGSGDSNKLTNPAGCLHRPTICQIIFSRSPISYAG